MIRGKEQQKYWKMLREMRVKERRGLCRETQLDPEISKKY
jgi:hypothetical protein